MKTLILQYFVFVLERLDDIIVIAILELPYIIFVSVFNVYYV